MEQWTNDEKKLNEWSMLLKKGKVFSFMIVQVLQTFSNLYIFIVCQNLKEKRKMK